MIQRTLVGMVILIAFAASSLAELQPEEVAILVARTSRESKELAEHYAKARGIPTRNICAVDMPRVETMARQDWTWAVRPEIRKWITENDPQNKLRCLVTTWDVPLKIDRADDASQEYLAFLKAERANRLGALEETLQAFVKLAPGLDLSDAATSDSETASDDKSKASSELDQMKARLEKALKAAQAHVVKLPDVDRRRDELTQMQRMVTSTGGLNVILQGLRQQLTNVENAKPEIRAEFDRIRGHVIAFSEARALLEQRPLAIERDAIILWLSERMGGLLLSVEWLDAQLTIVKKGETNASFDSELSLVMWPDDYQLLRWQPNYLRPGYDKSALRDTYRTFMVARLDAPTFELAKGLVDTAIAVEKEGLKGKVYIDNRGIGKLDQKNVQPGSYADYDRALLITAKGLEEQSGMEVVLNESPKLFQPGECPDAALYCGWYSLAKYVDAFEWAPGAVAYHLASSEAATLRKPGSQVWCKRMLEDGVCATIGPVYEPYLMSFPRPDEFFSLLLKGDLTLVECYYRTKPYNSWMMTLIGDPLYRPFGKR